MDRLDFPLGSFFGRSLVTAGMVWRYTICLASMWDILYLAVIDLVFGVLYLTTGFDLTAYALAFHCGALVAMASMEKADFTFGLLRAVHVLFKLLFYLVFVATVDHKGSYTSHTLNIFVCTLMGVVTYMTPIGTKFYHRSTMVSPLP